MDIRFEDLTQTQREKLEARGKELWLLDHLDNRGILYLDDNKARLNAIERWYPFCYMLLQRHLSYIFTLGNDLGGNANLANNIIREHVPVSCYAEVKLSWC